MIGDISKHGRNRLLDCPRSQFRLNHHKSNGNAERAKHARRGYMMAARTLESSLTPGV